MGGKDETWYRGEVTGVAPSKPGAGEGDLGDGLYLSDTEQVARLYALTRLRSAPGQEPIPVAQPGSVEGGRESAAGSASSAGSSGRNVGGVDMAPSLRRSTSDA